MTWRTFWGSELFSAARVIRFPFRCVTGGMRPITPRISLTMATAALCVAATAASADYAKVDSANEFTSIVQGKTLTRPMIRLQVSPAGEISGTGAAWEVTGNWSWQDGYFCRDLYWGGDALGYNCQEVCVQGSKIRFTSDKGAGQSAEFRLRTE